LAITQVFILFAKIMLRKVKILHVLPILLTLKLIMGC